MSDAASKVDKHLELLVNVIFMFCFFRYTLFALAICHRRLAAYQFSNVYPFVRVPGSDIECNRRRNSYQRELFELGVLAAEGCYLEDISVIYEGET